GKRDDGLATREQEELRKLRRENARLKQEKEILRKVTVAARGAAAFAA
ncbi:MAG: hypothetical protein JO120_09685, partial [Solirubrobacterales bacterium]|nr:hypothetical protein [Solirubrobacterales bacterium]